MYDNKTSAPATGPGRERPTVTTGCTNPADGLAGPEAFADGPVDRLPTLLPGLHRYARLLTGNHADADDLVQIAVEKALQRPGGLAGVGNPTTWMRCILRNAWLDNRKSARHRYEAPVDEAFDPMGEDGETLLMARSQIRAVQKALATLSPDLRNALTLVSIQGLSYAEAADRLGIPVATLTSRIARARTTLAGRLDLLPPTPAPCRRAGP